MRIENINYITPRAHFCAQKSQKITGPAANKPLKESLTTAGAWFGFGVGLDLLSRKCRFSKSPTKNSLAINGILGLGAGIYTAVRELNSSKE